MRRAMSTPLNGLDQRRRKIWALFCLAANNFSQIGGVTWAGAFSFNAFFSLFPLIVLFVSIASVFIDHDKATIEIIGYVERYVPITGEMQRTIFDTVAGVVNARGQAGAVAFFLLVWVAIQCLSTLISAINRAWDVRDYNWWQLPVKSLALFGIMTVSVFLGIAVPVLATMVWDWLAPIYDFRSWVYGFLAHLIPMITVFFSLCLFYKFSPRRITRFTEVWIGAVCATSLLRATESLFVIYLRDFATLNAVYGAFGGIMALLLWIFLSGCIFIFGACLCVAQAEILLFILKQKQTHGESRSIPVPQIRRKSKNRVTQTLRYKSD